MEPGALFWRGEWDSRSTCGRGEAYRESSTDSQIATSSCSVVDQVMSGSKASFSLKLGVVLQPGIRLKPAASSGNETLIPKQVRGNAGLARAQHACIYTPGLQTHFQTCNPPARSSIRLRPALYIIVDVKCSDSNL